MSFQKSDSFWQFSNSVVKAIVLFITCEQNNEKEKKRDAHIKR